MELLVYRTEDDGEDEVYHSMDFYPPGGTLEQEVSYNGVGELPQRPPSPGLWLGEAHLDCIRDWETGYDDCELVEVTYKQAPLWMWLIVAWWKTRGLLWYWSFVFRKQWCVVEEGGVGHTTGRMWLPQAYAHWMLIKLNPKHPFRWFVPDKQVKIYVGRHW